MRTSATPSQTWTTCGTFVGDSEQHLARLDQKRLARLNERLRQAFITGAEEDSRRRVGRGLTAEVLERVLRRYLGDLPRSSDQ
jgi:hypothetical protein